jgi:hypothetical protein
MNALSVADLHRFPGSTNQRSSCKELGILSMGIISNGLWSKVISGLVAVSNCDEFRPGNYPFKRGLASCVNLPRSYFVESNRSTPEPCYYQVNAVTRHLMRHLSDSRL